MNNKRLFIDVVSIDIDDTDDKGYHWPKDSVQIELYEETHVNNDGHAVYNTIAKHVFPAKTHRAKIVEALDSEYLGRVEPHDLIAFGAQLAVINIFAED